MARESAAGCAAYSRFRLGICSAVYVAESGEPARADYLGEGLGERASGRGNFCRTSLAKPCAHRGDVRRRSDLGGCLSTCAKHLCASDLSLAHDVDCGLNRSRVSPSLLAHMLKILRFKLGQTRESARIWGVFMLF